MKILVGGVPFGRDNVGDEAILECVVNILRAIVPDAELVVSTDDQEATAKKLSVSTCPLFGFVPPGFDRQQMLSTIESVDAFVWSGATGLSDYPEIPLEMLQHAADKGKKTIVFNTGMNSELNPFLYQLMPGTRLKLFSALKSMTLGQVDLAARFERVKKARASARMEKALSAADEVIVRDAQSVDAIRDFVAHVPSLTVGADPAIEMAVKTVEDSPFADEVKKVCKEPVKRIGLCISAQRAVRQIKDIAAVFDRISADTGAKVVGIPMNPITDAKLMVDFRQMLEKPESMVVAEGRFEPDEITGLASKMDVVISSRLHLLILSSITKTPFIGISRGTKVTNFTSQFGLPDIGSVDTLAPDLLENEIRRLFDEREAFEAVAEQTLVEMHGRLDGAKKKLRELLLS